MRIFYMFGRFTQNGKWKTEEGLPNFAGCMMQEDNSNEIFGYQSELYSLDTKTLKEMSKIQMCAVEAAGGGSRIRFIRGFYNKEKNQLMFLKMTPSVIPDPLMYVFKDVNKEGIWSAIDPITETFFSKRALGSGIWQVADGKATISIEEITDEKEKKWRECEIKSTYKSLSAREHTMNEMLINRREEYKKFLDYDFEQLKEICGMICISGRNGNLKWN